MIRRLAGASPEEFAEKPLSIEAEQDLSRAAAAALVIHRGDGALRRATCVGLALAIS
jgi:hypothetical protein